MANGILGQANLAATTNTTVYTVPSSTTATVNIAICNRNGAPVVFRVALSTGGSPTDAEWIEYDEVIPGFGIYERTGVVLNAGKRVVVWSTIANVSVSVYGFEDTV